jgi:acyl carrier protein
MNREELRKIVVSELVRLAPEIDVATLSDGVRIRDELDLDSFDFVRFVAALDERLRVPTPESDYARLATLGGCLDYLQQKLEAAPLPA